VRRSSAVVHGPRLDPVVFRPQSVPAATRTATERLRREGATAPALSEERIEELHRSPPSPAGALAVEPPCDQAMDRVIDGPVGPLRLRVLRSGEVRACYVHVHGGGWALGGADRQDRTLLRFASAARVAVVAVDYRLTPEHPHPAGVADCVAAIRWLAARGERELGAGRLIVGGESAGAHLAALALLSLRDLGEIERVAAANLAYGVYDVSMTPSARRWGDQRIVVNTPDLAFFADHYAPRERHRDPDVSPLYADLIGMPPALFSCGTLDPLLDDTLFMAARWEAAGSPAGLALYAGAPHEFLNLRNPIAAAADARGRMVAFVERALTDGGQPPSRPDSRSSDPGRRERRPRPQPSGAQ
jgi:acetyl esterase/lipase